ncbi:hypothetical protein [Actinomadura decatromicini]|uniref:Uncharacterized protein n=1 Tax=Actinomadura decatromicini TaxID=2604572 RepID=A0A5D3FUV1_9ACTN|nr:hypothetical protein [Actinomadura decatromicini]TYK52647.1 hypothetical protein FXF68_02430 [Actinomadura decatromicini]
MTLTEPHDLAAADKAVEGSSSRSGSCKRIVEAFSQELHAAYHKAGIRGYKAFAARSEKINRAMHSDTGKHTYVSRSAAYEPLTGKRERLPSWDQVAQFVRVFRAEAADRGIAPDSVDTMAEWKEKYEAASAAFWAAKPVPGSRVPRTCGQRSVSVQ